MNPNQHPNMSAQPAQTPRSFNYGPYRLDTTPSGTSISFKPKAQPIKPEQQCLLDKLWNSRAQKYYVNILQAVAHYFIWVNIVMGS